MSQKHSQILQQLKEFIDESKNLRVNRKWLSDDKMSVYVRKAQRYLNGIKITTLDIASVEVYIQGKGTFTTFLEAAHKLNPWDATYIENTLTQRFAEFFRKKLWHSAQGNTGIADSFYLFTSQFRTD